MTNIAFAGGGTGGHVFPISSLINTLKNSKYYKKINNIIWLGTKNSLEEKTAKDIDNVYFVSINSGKFRREKSINSFFLNFIDIFKFGFGFFQALYYLRINKVDVIFCKGGYVALPTIFAGKLLGLEIFVHESDTVPGLTNKIAAKFSTKNFCGYPNCLKNSLEVGQILSNDLLSFSNKLDLSNYDLNKTNVLVIGGSQGAKFIYNNLLTILSEVDSLDNYNFFVVLGNQYDLFFDDFNKYSNIKTFNFLNHEDLGYLYNICDISITRGGATSLAEQKKFNIKLFIVPLPYTGGNHQYWNAKYYFETYGDELITQDYKFKDTFKQNLLRYKSYKKDKIDISEVDLENSNMVIWDEVFSYL